MKIGVMVPRYDSEWASPSIIMAKKDGTVSVRKPTEPKAPPGCLLTVKVYVQCNTPPHMWCMMRSVCISVETLSSREPPASLQVCLP